MSTSPFNKTASYGEESPEESAVRFIINTSVEEGKASIKRCENLTIIREALTRETEGSRRRSLLNPLRTKFKALKAAEAKAAAAVPVEVVHIDDTLDQCSIGIKIASTRIETEHTKYERTTKYDRVLIGLWLLKAKHLHLCPTVGRRDKKTGQLTSASGFQDWLIQENPQIKKAALHTLRMIESCLNRA